MIWGPDWSLLYHRSPYCDFSHWHIPPPGVSLIPAEQASTVADALASAGPDQLWEDNWDDDDIEDDFQKQLRQAIAERAGGGDEAMKE